MLLFFKKLEVTGIVEPDECLLRSPHPGSNPKSGKPALWVFPSFKKEDGFLEVRPEFAQINLHYWGEQKVTRVWNFVLTKEEDTS